MRSFRIIVVGRNCGRDHVHDPRVILTCASWPRSAPPTSGPTCFLLPTRQPSSHRLRTGLAATLASALIAGVVAFVGISSVVTIALHVIHPTPAQLGVSTGLVTAANHAAVAPLSGITFIAEMLPGVQTLPLSTADAICTRLTLPIERIESAFAVLHCTPSPCPEGVPIRVWVLASADQPADCAGNRIKTFSPLHSSPEREWIGALGHSLRTSWLSRVTGVFLYGDQRSRAGHPGMSVAIFTVFRTVLIRSCR
jgi:hypothetical protein